MKFIKSLKLMFACLIFVNLVSCVSNQESELPLMKRRSVNPWLWQENMGFVQSNEITGAKRMLFTAGIVSVDAEGNLLYPNDMEQQVTQVMDNMKVLLKQAGFELSDVVRFTYYTTSIPDFTKAAQKVLIERLQKESCKPATSLIGVAALFHPDCVVEIEAVVAD